MKFSCTSKIIKIIKDKPLSSLDINDEFNWYVDLLKLGRKRYFLFTHEKTLFSFISYMGTNKHLKEFNANFHTRFTEQIIRIYGFDDKFFDQMEKYFQKAIYCKTTNRSVLGSMNDFKANIMARIANDGESDEVINSINYYLNIMPMGMLNYQSPMEVFKNAFKL